MKRMMMVVIWCLVFSFGSALSGEWASPAVARTLEEPVDAAQNDAEVVKSYKKAAEQGDSDAQYQLGVMYEMGLDIPQHYAEAVKWYRRAAEQGSADAQRSLGIMYEEGRGVGGPPDAAEAVKWYRRAAEQGSADAQRSLGIMYEEGRGVGGPPDAAEAVKWYRRAAEQGSADAQRSLGIMYEEGRGVGGPPDAAEAVKWYRRAAEQGSADAQRSLGIMYEEGRGVGGPPDAAEAVKWYRRAAEQGSADAQNKLWEMLYAHQDLEPHDIEKEPWYRWLADRRNELDAYYNLGAMYFEGTENIEQNYPRAFDEFQKAAEQGHPGAQTMLGSMYLHGQGVRENLSRAFDEFQKAAEQGHPGAQYMLGSMYLHGQGVRENLSRAFDEFQKAAEQGHSDAQYELGKMMFIDTDVDEDLDKAVQWFLRAATQGNAEAQMKIAVFYMYGIGVSPDDVATIAWLRKAASSGSTSAQFRLGSIYDRGEFNVVQSDTEAVKWYRKAAGESADASFELGSMYKNKFESMYSEDRSVVRDDPLLQVLLDGENDGEKINWDAEESELTDQIRSLLIMKAHSFFVRSAEKGNGGAQLELGQIYEDGLGVAKSVVTAHKWYNLAVASATASGDLKQAEQARQNRDRVTLLLDAVELAHAQKLAEKEWQLKDTSAIIDNNMPSENLLSQIPDMKSFGSGFWISTKGHILTNYHVVKNCGRLHIPGFGTAKILSDDKDKDLVLIRVSEQDVPAVATFRRGWEIDELEEVIVPGYPTNPLSIAGNFIRNQPSITIGIVTDTQITNEITNKDLIQISAEIHKGNSGGPVLDNAGNVVAVVVSIVKWDRYLKHTGTLPQNINFAIAPGALQEFLEFHLPFPVEMRPSDTKITNADMLALVKSITVQIMCTH